jgi:beta-lactamase class A
LPRYNFLIYQSLFPSSKNPIIIAAYFDSGEYTEKVEARHEAVLAEVGKIAAEWGES